MKIILSRKGFDGSCGGCASPILPDGKTLLSLPIPDGKDKLEYADLSYDGLSYDQLLKQLRPKTKPEKYSTCHLDPDIRKGIRSTPIPDWQPAFGQINAAQGVLRNNGVGKDDLFLFFGWFKQTVFENGVLRYKRGAPDLHVIYGYLQVDRVLTRREDVEKYHWHPHAADHRRSEKTNALYIARKTLSFDDNLPGSGVLDLSDGRILTLEGQTSRSVWKYVPALGLSNIITEKEKTTEDEERICYNWRWQELILKDNDTSRIWAENILR